MNSFFFGAIGALILSQSAMATQTDTRLNVMECTDEEVRAYIAKPDPNRQAVMDYHAFEKAHMHSEIKKTEKEELNNPEACWGMLYGDLAALGQQMRDIEPLLQGFSMPNISGLLSNAMDKLSESVCKRVKAAPDLIGQAVKREADKLKSDALYELDRRYGEAALNDYVNEAFIPPEYQSMGLQFRNSKIDKDAFRDGVREAWKDRMDELVDDIK